MNRGPVLFFGVVLGTALLARAQELEGPPPIEPLGSIHSTAIISGTDYATTCSFRSEAAPSNVAVPSSTLKMFAGFNDVNDTPDAGTRHQGFYNTATTSAVTWKSSVSFVPSGMAGFTAVDDSWTTASPGNGLNYLSKLMFPLPSTANPCMGIAA